MNNIPRRVLVRATNWVGDAVMSLPALRAVRAHLPPDTVIDVLARPWVAELYCRESYIHEILLLESDKGPRDWRGKWRTARRLRARCYDCALLFQNAFEAALLTWLARIPRRIGYDRDARGWLLTDPVRMPRPGEIPAYQGYYYLELLRRAGWLDELPERLEVRLEGAAAAAEEGRRLLVSRGLVCPVVGVSPGAAFGSAKRWLPERFAESAAELARSIGASVAVFGSAGERALCEQVAGAASQLGVRAQSLAGATSLKEYIAMAAACQLYLANDSGAMHVASALGVPTVGIFGATDPRATRPAGPHWRIVQEPADCSPCLLRECPLDHRCMQAVSTRRVVEEASALLEEAARRS